MSINALKKLQLGRKLSDLLKEQSTAGALDRLELAAQITAVLKELGFDATKISNSETTSENNDVPPQLVLDFLNGKFNTQDVGDYIITLNDISDYVGTHLTLDEVKTQAALWIDNHTSLQSQGA